MIEQSATWYQASAHEAPRHARLRDHQRADVCIVGGGFTGISAALELAQAGLRVVVLEAEQLGSGCSGRNGGQINPGPACNMASLVRQLGSADASRVWSLTLEGVKLLRERVRTFGIDCDLKFGILQVAGTPRQVEELQAWQAQLERLGYAQLEYHDQTALRALLQGPYLAGVMDHGGGDLHPLNYLYGLARAAHQAGALIFEQSAVRDWSQDASGVQLLTEQGSVQAGHAILAGNAYVGKLLPWGQRRFLPVGSYIGATRPLGDLAPRLIPSRAAVCDMKRLLDYYRLTPDNRLLFGGRASARDAHPDRLRQAMRERMTAVFPALAGEDFEYLWGGKVAMTLNKAPQFGRIGNRVLFAQGYSGQGVALSGLAGLLMAQAVLGRSESFDLFGRIRHAPVPPGSSVQSAIRGLALLWYRLQDLRG